MCVFLCYVFISSPVPELIPQKLVSELTRFKDVGSGVYNRVQSNKPYERSILEVTIIQLFAVSLVEFKLANVKKNSGNIQAWG